MPMWHNYLMNFGLATVMQHALDKVPSTCMRIMPPCPPEPKDNLTAFLDSLGNTSVSHAPVTPLVPPLVMPTVPPPIITPLPRIPASVNLGMGPVPTTTVPVFGGAPCICRHGDRCISFPSFPCSTSVLQAIASKHPCRLHFLCSSCCIHTEGV